MTTRDFSTSQEKYLAKLLSGKVQPNSGGTKFSGGDVVTEYFLIEAKTSTKDKKSFSIKKEWIQKAEEQAFEQNKKESVVAFNFGPNGENFFILNEQQFRDYLKYKESNLCYGGNSLYGNKE